MMGMMYHGCYGIASQHMHTHVLKKLSVGVLLCAAYVKFVVFYPCVPSSHGVQGRVYVQTHFISTEPLLRLSRQVLSPTYWGSIASVWLQKPLGLTD